MYLDFERTKNWFYRGGKKPFSDVKRAQRIAVWSNL